jgi:acetyltransferase-like isoleucine patch superfamily enzyme
MGRRAGALVVKAASAPAAQKDSKLVKATLKNVPGIRLILNVLYYLIDDLRTGRFRAIFFGGLGNFLPDLLAFGFIRACLWRAAGAQLSDCATTVIRAGVFIETPKKLVARKNFQINRETYLDASGGIEIGQDVTISLGCKILSMRHSGLQHENYIYTKTTIRDNSIVYAGATILPGACIEPFVIVAAGAVLSGRTVPGGVYAGVPAKLIKIRDDISPEKLNVNSSQDAAT